MKYEIAILYNYTDSLPPSNVEFLDKYQQVARTMNVNTEVIEAKDFPILESFDALFIRETTYVSHYTGLFARRAEQLGMPVIDDVHSILHCSSKAYLTGLLNDNDIPHPHSSVITRRTVKAVPQEFAYPIVIKLPISSFSLGVYKVANEEEFLKTTDELFDEHEVLVVQEYLPTAYDWRIGVLRGEPLFACKYYMARDDWKILKYDEYGQYIDGDSETFAIEDVPPDVVALALQGAKFMGNGLYGVDLKETDHGPVIIEINDNPNIDAGVEDLVGGKKIYESLIRALKP